MKKKNLEHHHHSIGIVILVVVAVMMVLVALSYFNPNMFFSNRNTSNEHSNLAKDNTYSSDFLNISFVVPEGFEVEEKAGVIVLRKDGEYISLGFNGTNFDNLDDYYKSHVELNKLQDVRDDHLNINGLNWIRSEVVGNGERYPSRTYWTYPAKWRVYSISTNSTDSYDELDQIAQSFRYTGD